MRECGVFLRIMELSNKKKIGIYGVQSQSGKAYFADLISRGYSVIGYFRPEGKGKIVADAVNSIGGIFLERPANSNLETSKFLPLNGSMITSDLEYMISHSDLIIFSLPSIYQLEAIKSMKENGLQKFRKPIVLSPSRTIASPYLWKILGERYPIVCFSTCPYSCKSPAPEISYIKRRKRTWTATLEGDFSNDDKELLNDVFPQAAFSLIPALTSLNNIGAVFHCATYLLNIEKIHSCKKRGEVFSFYMDGIAYNEEIGKIIEQIDQVRLDIADKLRLQVFGLNSTPKEDIWRRITNALRALESEHEGEIEMLRTIRKQFVEYLNNSILSAQHWLDITYGVQRIENEGISSAIGRTPTYQKNSIPQYRYVEEDIPTGLVPFEALALRLNVECVVITSVINKYNEILGSDIRKTGRNLSEFSTDYLINYLQGIY